jgi:hypothetical protein
VVLVRLDYLGRTAHVVSDVPPQRETNVSVAAGRNRSVLTGRRPRLELTPAQQAQCEEYWAVEFFYETLARSLDA